MHIWIFIRFSLIEKNYRRFGRNGELRVEQGDLQSTSHVHSGSLRILRPAGRLHTQEGGQRTACCGSSLWCCHCTWLQGRRTPARAGSAGGGQGCAYGTPRTRGRMCAGAGEQDPTQPKWTDLCLRGLSVGAQPSLKAGIGLHWKSSPLLSPG